MWKMLLYGAGLTHTVVGTWPLLATTSHAHPFSWLSLGIGILGPGLAELAIAALLTVARSPKDTVAKLPVA